jgi:hypothetical protein
MSSVVMTVSSQQSHPKQKQISYVAIETRKDNFQKLEELMQRRQQCLAVDCPTILTFIETTKEEDLSIYDEKYWEEFAKMIQLYFGRTFKQDKIKLSWNKASAFVLRSVICRRLMSFSDKRIVFIYEMARQFDCFDETQPRFRCTFCNYFYPKMKTCSGCHRWPYCSEACRKNDWLSHRSICMEVISQRKEEKLTKEESPKSE